jgi:Fe2+ or Zn2+ uptake regulation protein
VRAQLPGVSLGTIYRTVDILREIGLVQIFAHNGMAARYEASLSKHHHLVCALCHDIVNVNIPSLGSLVTALVSQYHYDDVDASLTVTGRCANCAAHAHAVAQAPRVAERGELRERDFEGTAARRE